MIALYYYGFFVAEVCFVKAFGFAIGTAITTILFTAGLVMARRIGA